MPDGSGLAETTTTADRYMEVEFVSNIAKLERLSDDHARSFPTKVLIKAALVDLDITFTRSHVDACFCRLSSTCSVILIHKNS